MDLFLDIHGVSDAAGIPCFFLGGLFLKSNTIHPSFLVFCLSITAVMKYPTERRENKFSANEMKERLGAVVINWHKSEHESIVSRFLGWTLSGSEVKLSPLTLELGIP